MNSFNLPLALVGCIFIGMPGPANAGGGGSRDDANLRAEVRALRARVAELESAAGETWFNERRAEEVKGLIREVLADAEDRATMLDGGYTAGHDGKKFFLASTDDLFLLQIGGHLQYRFVNNFRSGAGDNHDSGFEFRRAKLKFSGHVGDPRLDYKLQIGVDRSSGAVEADAIVISYELRDGLVVWGGEDTAPFLREEMVSSKYQLAVERSLVNEVFTVDKVQGIGATWMADEAAIMYVTLHDGTRSAGESFSDDDTEIGIAARVDVRLAGEWGQAKDFAAWAGEETALFFGAAIDWELLESDDEDHFVVWTVDGGFEQLGWSIYAAVMGRSTDFESEPDRDASGFVAQISHMLVPDKIEPFLRWEYIDLDDPGLTEDQISLLTVGANWYLNKHRTKFTLDLVWAADPIPSRDGLGGVSTGGLDIKPDAAGHNDQVTVRAQGQLLF